MPRTSKEIEQRLTEELSRELDVPMDEIDPQSGFDRYGLDSMAAVNITLKMEDWLDLELSPNLPFKYRSVRTLADYLSRRSQGSENPS